MCPQASGCRGAKGGILLAPQISAWLPVRSKTELVSLVLNHPVFTSNSIRGGTHTLDGFFSIHTTLSRGFFPIYSQSLYITSLSGGLWLEWSCFKETPSEQELVGQGAKAKLPEYGGGMSWRSALGHQSGARDNCN